MQKKDLIDELELLIRSRYGLIVLETMEEGRAEEMLRHLSRRMNLPLFLWNMNKGLFRTDLEETIYGTHNLGTALSHVCLSEFRAVYHFQGIGPLLQDMSVSSKLSGAARHLAKIGGAMVMTGKNLEIADDAKVHTAVVDMPLPESQEYAELLKNIYYDLSKKMQLTVDMKKTDIQRLIHNLKGLTLIEAKKILTKAMIEDKRLSPEDIQYVIDAKKNIIEREGLLEYFPVNEKMHDVADLSGLKTWLTKRKHFITNPEKARRAGLSFPKGVLLLGIPGTGKSLCAKAVAMEWNLPLLKMDPANLYSKYIGETEKRFKRAMKTAEEMAPLVLWVDEIEKAFAAGGNEDGGVSTRVLGTFLSWMQERKGDVFVVATANDVTCLPPELLRKGRFDEIFFMDLPDLEARGAILKIHLNRRGHDPSQFDIIQIAEAMEGFSGAEIEQVIVSSMYTALSENHALSTQFLITETKSTMPLAKTRAEHIAGLRSWAKDRTVKAN